jgi:hypothetical protein
MAKKSATVKSREGNHRSPATPVAAQQSVAEPVRSSRTEEKVLALYHELGTQLKKTDAPGQTKEVELHIALARYLADDKLNRVISQLEEVARECPGTAEGMKADAAIHALRGSRHSDSDEVSAFAAAADAAEDESLES